MTRPIAFAEPLKRLDFGFEAAVVRAPIAASVPGVYCVLADKRPIYIGRSDHCLATRPAHHALAALATHFVCEPSLERWTAFCLESYWWHRLREFPELQNRIDPACPNGSTRGCPFCNARDSYALARLLAWIPAESSSRRRLAART